MSRFRDFPNLAVSAVVHAVWLGLLHRRPDADWRARADFDRFGAVPLKGKLWKPKLIASGDKFDDGPMRKLVSPRKIVT